MGRKMEKKRLLEKMTKEQKESIDMDTDEDLSDAHEEKSKESAAKAEENDSEKVSARRPMAVATTIASVSTDRGPRTKLVMVSQPPNDDMKIILPSISDFIVPIDDLFYVN